VPAAQDAALTARSCTSDGWGVEVITITATPDRHDGESFRVSRRAERWIELTALDEASSHPDGRPAVQLDARLTDDAGLHWEIGPDMGLVKLDRRDW
jgi:hypothetical protein